MIVENTVPGPVPGGRAQPHRLHPGGGREGDGGLPERGPAGEGGEEVRGTGLEVSLTGDQAGGRRGRGGLLLLPRHQVELEGERLQLLRGHRRPHRQVDQVAGQGGAGGGDRDLGTRDTCTLSSVRGIIEHWCQLVVGLVFQTKA